MTPARPWAVWLSGYVLTTGVAIAVSLGIRLVLSSVGPFGASSCAALDKAVPILLVVIAGEFLVSIGLIGSVIWKIALVDWERRVIPLGYGLALVATYVALALGIEVVFSC